MELRHLRYFVAVAEELNFRRASARLHVAQPSLSQQIQQLERELGVRLFTRTKRRVALTQPGRLFLTEARRALAQVKIAVEVARGAEAGEMGRLRIGYVDSALWGVLPEAIRRYRERFPQVTLVLRERLPAPQLSDLERGELDVAIGPPPPPDASVESTPVTDEAMMIALPTAHPRGGDDAIRLADLAGDPWVLVAARVPSRMRDLAVGACIAAGFTPRVAQEARELDALVALVSAGLGVTLVPESLARVPRPGVVFLPLLDHTPSFRLDALWSRGEKAPALGTFLDVLREVVPLRATSARG